MGFVYVWYDRAKSMYYVGSHWGDDGDAYVCSSSWMKRSFSRRPEDFKRRIVARVSTSKSDLRREEDRWLRMIKPHEMKPHNSTPRYYNLRNSAWDLWHDDLEYRLTVGQKISAAKKGKTITFSDPTARAKQISDAKQKKRLTKLPPLETIKELFSQGLKLPEVATHLETTPYYVRSVLQDNGYKSAKELFPKKETLPSRRPGDAMREKWADPEWRERQRARLAEGAKSRPPRSEESKRKARDAQIGRPKARQRRSSV